MIDKTSLVSVEHSIDTEWKELVVEHLLDDFLTFIFLGEIIEIEEIGQAIVIIVRAPHITLLLTHDFTKVLHHECTCWDLLHGDQAPHRDLLRRLGEETAVRAVCRASVGGRLLLLLVDWLKRLVETTDEKLELLLVLR